MKKILIAAIAATVVGGAFAACDYDPVVKIKDRAWAYTWKFSGKTTKGAVVKGTKGTSGVCGYETPGSLGGFVRVPASLKIQGYTWYCDPGCGSDDFEAALAEVNEVFYQKKPVKTGLNGGVTIEVSNIIGKKAKQYEIAGVAQFDGTVDGLYNDGSDAFQYVLTFAGLGKYDKKNSRVSSASGNFAGTLEYPWYVSKTVCAEAKVWDCVTLTLVEDSVTSVAYGKWSVKFNKSTAKKLANNKAAAPKFPKWVYNLNAIAALGE